MCEREKWRIKIKSWWHHFYYKIVAVGLTALTGIKEKDECGKMESEIYRDAPLDHVPIFINDA